ncbi:hypothetical protein B0H13DRAFT_2262834 [Mycena leptocephala]|nr:hypothetical protein B0H13DRAFT_2262834 [Mycena leptocephala]
MHANGLGRQYGKADVGNAEKGLQCGPGVENFVELRSNCWLLYALWRAHLRVFFAVVSLCSPFSQPLRACLPTQIYCVYDWWRVNMMQQDCSAVLRTSRHNANLPQSFKVELRMTPFVVEGYEVGAVVVRGTTRS